VSAIYTSAEGARALGRLTMPMLVTVGGRDGLLDSYDTRRRLERTVPHVIVNVLPEAGHLLQGQTLPILDFLHTPDEPRRHA
jgi:pimeloyl-ACP methyl ester carboxylesterase